MSAPWTDEADRMLAEADDCIGPPTSAASLESDHHVLEQLSDTR